MKNSENVSFFTPIVFDQGRTTLGKYLLEKVDGYFSFYGKRAFVISKTKADKSFEVQMKDYQSSFHSKLIFTVLKIVTYITLVIPTFMFLAKLALRSIYSFDLLGKSKDRGVFIFGDIHGELDGFQENLIEGEIIDKENNWVKGNTATVIQMGDIIDRGPKSLKTYEYLALLQEQAIANGGKVIRLIGNHELMILQRNYRYAKDSGLTFEECDRLRNRIIEDIKANKISFAWTDGKRLYTHAGVRSVIRETLKKEILDGRRGFLGLGKILSTGEEVSLNDIVKYTNELLKKAVKTNDFSHVIFLTGKSRGGDALIGGPLWEDVGEILRSQHARDINQVIAHNPPKGILEQPIRITDSIRLINVDAGLCENYGKNNAFVQIHDERVFVHEKLRSITSLFMSRRWEVREVA